MVANPVQLTVSMIVAKSTVCSAAAGGLSVTNEPPPASRPDALGKNDQPTWTNCVKCAKAQIEVETE
jgi:hypothetical protein